MRSRRVVPAFFFVILAAALLGSGVASARPAQNRVAPVLDVATPTVAPAGHDGERHCRTRRDPVMPDPADF